ncbi:MAG: hypothetical protein QOH50_5492 [Kribbellaceae bacterium]|jgi:hypothetical protein|nr:hypothetical protein [Kribbellaceae bacterium]
MSSTLNPSLSVAQNMKNSISGVLQSDFPGETRALMIAPLLTSFNKWSTQIPFMLEGTGHSASANLVFSVRKELFHAPAFSTCTLGIPLKELPQAFTEFLEFIQKLQDAQRLEKDKVILKVHSLFFLLVAISDNFFHQPPRRGGKTIKSKAIIDDKDDEDEPAVTIVSRHQVDSAMVSTDEAVGSTGLFLFCLSNLLPSF